MVRKGIGKKSVHDKEAIQVDNFSHTKLNDIFNKSKQFVCYDPYTYYSYYASLCGCMSIVVPDSGVDKEQWQPNEENRYGISYGLDDVDYALKTKKKMLEHMNERDENSIDSVKNFIQMCEKYFKTKIKNN